MKWVEDFDRIAKQNDGFGVNCFYDLNHAKDYFTKLYKLGANINIIDYENIEIILPEDKNESEKILLFILTEGVLPTDTQYCYATRRLDLSWS